jgi:8-oxo-dGTP diphosphatase
MNPRPRPASYTIQNLLGPLADRSPPAGAAGAAVLILLRPHPRSPEVATLLMERAERAGDPGSGQISLPGGRAEAGDRDLAATALRESAEEVGLRVEALVGPPRYVATDPARAFGLTVAIFAAELRSDAAELTGQDPREVASTFWMPLRQLARTEPVERSTSSGPRAVEAAVYEGHVVWGFTRGVLRRFVGLDPPSSRGAPGSLAAPAALPP